MKQFLTLLIISFFHSTIFAISLAETEKLVGDEKYNYLIFNALNKSANNQEELLQTIKSSPEKHKTAVLYLISFMPERDLRDLKKDYILENVRLAYQAKETFLWAKNIPEEIFLNEVLPYATLNERRDNWRADFFKRFSEMVKDCQTAEEAAIKINQNIKENLGVIYSTKRAKADQSPYESMESKLASCTGLSILLVNAFRSVGIPSRIAGVPVWTGKTGNHNWNEVWINGEWKFTEYYFDGLNKGWYLKEAAEADETKWENKVYATSFATQPYWFPCVWDFNIRFVHAVDVSKNYKKLYRESLINKNQENGQTVRIILRQKPNGERVKLPIAIINKEGIEVQKGISRSEEDDLNNILEFKLVEGEYFAVLPNGEKRPFVVTKQKVNSVNLFVENPTN